MKKIYVNPEMEVVKMETMSVLADSGYSTMGFGSGTTTTMDASEFHDNGDSNESW